MSNTICPICGKDDTETFFDRKLHQQGYHCLSCNRDFGVDDGKKIKQYEDELNDFVYERVEKDSTIKRIYIKKILDKVTLKPELIKNKVLQPYQEADISDLWPTLKKFLFEQIYILDWPDTLTGFLTGKNDESYEIDMKFQLALINPIVKKGEALLPPYLKALDTLFSSFFEINTENEQH
ncbi:MAG: hypothetical protein WCS80_04825 [Bacilli bacterium]